VPRRFEDGVLAAKRASFTLRSRFVCSKCVGGDGKEPKIWKDFSVLPGKQMSYAALYSGADWLMGAGQVNAMLMPGENSEFEKGLMARCSARKNTPIELYLVEKNPVVCTKILETFGGYRGVYVANARLYKGEFSNPVFKHKTGELELGFADLAGTTNLVWFDFQGRFSNDYYDTMLTYLTNCGTPRAVLALTTGMRGSGAVAAGSPEDLVKRYTTGVRRRWDLVDDPRCCYRSGVIEMSFYMFLLKGR
jgi:hypothetical protein